MNQASIWRQDLARRIAHVYAANPRVAAVILGGSTARGHADQYSDVELGVFWHEPPSDIERRAAIEQVGADLIYLYPFNSNEEVWCDDITVGRSLTDQPQSGVLFEVSHYTTVSMKRTLDLVLRQYDPSESKQNLISGVVDCVPLHGIPLIEHWQSRAAIYPEKLAVAVVNRHALIDHFWRWEILLHRGENLMLVYQSLSSVQQKLLHVLLGLNRVYYFGFKWLDVVAARLKIAPADLTRRFRQVYEVPPAEGVQQLAALVEETYDLVARYLPAVDVDRRRAVFRYRRPVWEAPPPGLGLDAAPASRENAPGWVPAIESPKHRDPT